jgi:PucR C-terminal helix-turn-helix domain
VVWHPSLYLNLRTQVTKARGSEPWRALPPNVAEIIEPELDAITDEILAAIAREVPEYARPLEGSFGQALRVGVTEALSQFVELIRSPSGARGPGREVYVGLGRGELRQGRTLDSLQSAYRVGARVAWRQLAAAARAADLDPEVLSLLAESIFAFIEELSADSVEGYAEARAAQEDERRRLRRDLLRLLLREPPADDADVRAAATAAGWRLPRSVAALACPEDDLDRLARRLPDDALTARVDGLGAAVVPDPEGPGRLAELERAAERATAGLGPAGPLAELPASWRLARTALGAVGAGGIEPAGGAAGLVRADDALTEALLHQGRDLVERMARRRLAPLGELTPRARARMEETLLAYVREQGNAAATARALDVHPQTARYRLARLRALLGDELDDPDARFEIELALRGLQLRERARSPPA